MGKNSFEQFENLLSIVKGSYTPEQFGVFLNMYSWDVEDNYLVLFHETFHHWQSIFTPYGHLNWGCSRTVSSEVINLWLIATKNCPSSRILPIGDIFPCMDINQASCVSKILLQDIAWQVSHLRERIIINPVLRKILPISIDEICPTIILQGQPYQLNGIDILEGWAKFQEASLAFIVEEKQLSEVINPEILRPEYYSALYYFFDKVGAHRLAEFPVVCELALLSGKLCNFEKDGNWKKYHPAWRFVKIIDTVSKLTKDEYLTYNDVRDSFNIYTEKILRKCNFENWENSWTVAREYANQGDLNIPRDMLKAIDMKNRFPWILSFPFLDINVYQELKDFHPYYYITSDGSSLAVNSNSLANEVAFENHYQALAHQILGHISERCLDRGKVQCGYSYYGLRGCQYMLNGICDGHVDHNSSLPGLVLDDDSNVLEGCDFQIFLGLMGVTLQDIVVTDIAKKIDPDLLKADIERLTSES